MRSILLFSTSLLLTIFFSGCSSERVFEWEFVGDGEALRENQKRVEESFRASNQKFSSEIGEIKENSIQNLLNKKGNFKCSWRIEKEEIVEEADVDNLDEEVTGGVEEGVVYVLEDKLLKEVLVKENSRENKVSILLSGKQVYQWSSISPQGTKMSLMQAKNSGLIDLQRGYSWKCEEGVVQEEIFKLPEDFKFIEIKDQQSTI